MFNLLTENELKELREGILKTYNLEVLEDTLWWEGIVPTSKLKVQHIRGKTILTILDQSPINLEEKITEFKRVVELCGYKIVRYRWCKINFEEIKEISLKSFTGKVEGKKEIGDVELIVERNTEEQVHTEDEFGGVLFHATPKRVWESKISRVGLSPKEGSKKYSHPPRVYFTNSITRAVSLISQVSSYSKKKDSEDNEIDNDYVILQVNIKGLKDLKIYEDHFSPKDDCYYITENIPPDRLTIVREIKTN